MKPFYIAYGYQLEEPTNVAPCGMARIVHMDRKAPSPRQQRFTCELAAKRGYGTVVFFKDDVPVRTVELW